MMSWLDAEKGSDTGRNPAEHTDLDISVELLFFRAFKLNINVIESQSINKNRNIHHANLQIS